MNDHIHNVAEMMALLFSTSDVELLLGDHTADATGHCRGCLYPTTPPPVWPCRLWEIGNETRRIWGATTSA